MRTFAIIFAATVFLSISPFFLFAQTPVAEERLFCGVCGTQNELRSVFCFECGNKLEKSALLYRLRARIAAADSLKQPIVLSPSELSVFVQEESEQKAKELVRRRYFPPREKTGVEKAFGIIVPIAIGTITFYLLGQGLME